MKLNGMLRILWHIVHEMANDDVTMSSQNGCRHFFRASSARTLIKPIVVLSIIRGIYAWYTTVTW